MDGSVAAARIGWSYFQKHTSRDAQAFSNLPTFFGPLHTGTLEAPGTTPGKSRTWSGSHRNSRSSRGTAWESTETGGTGRIYDCVSYKPSRYGRDPAQRLKFVAWVVPSNRSCRKKRGTLLISCYKDLSCLCSCQWPKITGSTMFRLFPSRPSAILVLCSPSVSRGPECIH